MTMNVGEEIERLKTEITRLGTSNDDGSITVKFGTLFNDDRCSNIFEALVGTLRAAKKRKILNFDAEMLFQGVHDNVDIVLAKPKEATTPLPPPKEVEATPLPPPKEAEATPLPPPKEAEATETSPVDAPPSEEATATPQVEEPEKPTDVVVDTPSPVAT